MDSEKKTLTQLDALAKIVKRIEDIATSFESGHGRIQIHGLDIRIVEGKFEHALLMMQPGVTESFKAD